MPQKLLTALLLAVALPLAAQDIRMPYAESVGEATVYAVPTHADFWLHYMAEGASVTEAMSKADGFATRVRNALGEREVRPADTYVNAPAVVDIERPAVEVTMQLRFHTSLFNTLEASSAEFARICDQLQEVATALDARVMPPLFKAADEDAIIRSAVAAATEKAYPAADAIAKTMKTSVYAVDTVSLLEVVWNEPPELQGTLPNLKQVSCTARVKVIYTLAQE